MTDKALFIPLMTEYFRAFEAGTKRWEYRAYGPRWNLQTCRVGRAAVLGHGYSGKGRLQRTIKSVRILPRHRAPIAAKRIYPSAPSIIAIELE